MPRKIVDETLKFTILVNGDSAKKEYGELERSNIKILESNKDLEAQAKKLEKANRQNSDTYKNLKNIIQSNNKVYQNQEKRMSELNKEVGINNLSMRQLSKEAQKLNGIMSNLDPNTQEWASYNKELQSVKGRMANLREEMRPVAASMEDQLEVLGNLGAGFSQLFSALASGNYQEASAGFATIKTGITGATKAALAFIATPLGLALAAIAGTVGAISFWAKYNEGLKESVILTEQITGLQGEEADVVRRQAKVMEEVYGADFKETLGAANGLVRDFKISFSEALDVIGEGLARGQINNNEYFDSLQEYDTFFAQAGFSANEFRKVIQTGYDLGIYTDKLPDAIKEMDISLREQTKSTRDALVNAFGAPFTDDILGRIKRGEITTKEALQEISAQAQKAGINVQQNAQLTADLFRGAGEDAGGAIKIFEAYNLALNEQERALTPLEEMTRDIADANRELAEAQEKALKSDNYLSLSNDVQLFWTRTKTAFFNGIDFIVDVFSSWNQTMTKFWVENIATIAAFPTVVKASFIKVKNEVFDVVKTFGGLGDVIQNLMAFKFEAAADSFTIFKNNFKKEVGDVGDAASDAVDMIKDIRKKAGDTVDANFEKRRQGAAAQNTVSRPGSSVPIVPTNGNGSGGGSATPDKAEKARLAQIKKNEAELTQFILAEQEKRALAGKTGIEKELALIDAKYAKEMAKAGENEELKKQLIATKQQEIDDLKVQKTIELADRLAAVEEENFTAQEDLRLQREAMEAETQAEKDAINLEREQFLAQQKLDVEQHLALERLNLAGATEQEITAIKKKFALQQQQLELNFSKGVKKQKKDEVKWTEMTEEQKLSAITGALGSAATAFNEGSAAWKAVKISETTITTYQAATNSYNALSSIPVVGPVLGAVAAAAAIAAGIANVKKIASTPLAKVPKPSAKGHEEGLYPIVRKQDGKVFNTRDGGSPVTQIVPAPTRFIAGEVQPEMIIDGDTFKKMDPAVTDYILRLAGKASPGYQNGRYPEEGGTSIGMEMLLPVLNSLNEKLDAPLTAQVLYGPEASLKQQEYDKKIRNTRQNAKIKK